MHRCTHSCNLDVHSQVCPVLLIDISDFIFLIHRTRIASSAQDTNVNNHDNINIKIKILTLNITIKSIFLFLNSNFEIFYQLIFKKITKIHRINRECVNYSTCNICGYLAKSVSTKNLSRISRGRIILIYVNLPAVFSGISEAMLAMLGWSNDARVRISISTRGEDFTAIDFFAFEPSSCCAKKMENLRIDSFPHTQMRKVTLWIFGERNLCDAHTTTAWHQLTRDAIARRMKRRYLAIDGVHRARHAIGQQFGIRRWVHT